MDDTPPLTLCSGRFSKAVFFLNRKPPHSHVKVHLLKEGRLCGVFTETSPKPRPHRANDYCQGGMPATVDVCQIDGKPLIKRLKSQTRCTLLNRDLRDHLNLAIQGAPQTNGMNSLTVEAFCCWRLLDKKKKNSRRHRCVRALRAPYGALAAEN